MKKFYKRKWVRITAIFLILTMLVTYWAGTVTSIRISAEATNEAMRYLAENTELLAEGNVVERMGGKKPEK